MDDFLDLGMELDDELEANTLTLEAGPVCRGCGCDDRHACAGGCIWATADLCSACVRRGIP
jgi:hypothetical protein